MYDIIIIGAGPAGLTSALYARRANKKVLVLESKAYGGQIINASNIGFGGASQVTSSICEGLKDISQHSFVVVLSSKVSQINERISKYPNVEVIEHSVSKSLWTKLSGRE